MRHIIFSIFLSISFNAFALELPFDKDGKHYTLDLVENSTSDSGAIHYRGKTKEIEDSWVRATQFSSGDWHGLVSIEDEIYALSQEISSSASSKSEIFSTTALDQDHSCEVRTPGTSTSLIHSYTASQLVSSDFSNECDGNYVDGVCVFSDLEFVFDQEFQDAYSSDPEGNADALVNMVEGYFLNQLGVGFNVISQTYLTDGTDIYSNTDSASSLLDSLFSRRCEQNNNFSLCSTIPDYDGQNLSGSSFEEADSIVHLVTGRDFTGSVAGIAFTDTFCTSNGGFNVGTSQLSYNGFGNVDGTTLAATATTIAHEIGHNFGSEHDGDGSTSLNATSCGGGFIMAPSFSRNDLATTFSSCSENTITASVGANIGQSCTTAPVDITLTAGTLSSTPDFFDDFTFNSAFTATISEIGFRSTGSASITITTSDATLNSASIGGSNCTVADDDLSALCSISASSSSAMDIDLELFISGTDVTITASDTTNAVYKDTDTSNSSASINFVPATSSFTITASDIALTNLTRPTISGTTDLADGSIITVSYDGTQLCTDTSSSSAWSCTPTSDLPQGENRIHITGPTGEVTYINVTVDSIAPSVSINSVNIASSVRPTLSGSTGLTDNTEGSISVTRGGLSICTISTFSGGTWSCSPNSDLSLNDTLIVTATDLAGNQATDSATVTETVTAATTSTNSGGGISLLNFLLLPLLGLSRVRRSRQM